MKIRYKPGGLILETGQTVEPGEIISVSTGIAEAMVLAGHAEYLEPAPVTFFFASNANSSIANRQSGLEGFKNV